VKSNTYQVFLLLLLMMVRGIWIDGEEKRESEENAESDESEEEGEGSDPKARKTRINHVLCFVNERE